MVSPAQRGASGPPGCGFCRKNREPIEVYRSHRIKDQHGNITCPQLSKYTCDLCGATGLRAHTRSYCPQLPANSDNQQQQHPQQLLQQQRPPQFDPDLERDLDQLIPREQSLEHHFNQVLWRQPEQLDYNLNEDQLFNINSGVGALYGYIGGHNGLVGQQQSGHWRLASYEEPRLIQQQQPPPPFLFAPTIGRQREQHQASIEPPPSGAAADGNFEPPLMHLSQAGVRNMGRVTNSRYNSAGRLRKPTHSANGGRPNHNYNGRNQQQ